MSCRPLPEPRSRDADLQPIVPSRLQHLVECTEIDSAIPELRQGPVRLDVAARLVAAAAINQPRRLIGREARGLQRFGDRLLRHVGRGVLAADEREDRPEPEAIGALLAL